MATTPVTRDGNQVLWRHRAVTAEDFSDIRKYVDDCLSPPKNNGNFEDILTTDLKLLKALVVALGGTLSSAEVSSNYPKVTRPPSLPKLLRGTQLKSAERKLSLLEKEQDAMTKRARKRQKDLRDKTRRVVDAWKDHHNQLRKWEGKMKMLAALRQSFTRQKAIKRLMREIDSAIASGGTGLFETLKWRLLPPGEPLFEAVSNYMSLVEARWPSRRCDNSRIAKILELRPSKAYLGHDEFDGYIVFLFENSPFAVLECPWTGNALYLLEGNWVELSKLSKSTLLHRHSQHAKRIIHDDHGRWIPQVEAALSRTRS